MEGIGVRTERIEVDSRGDADVVDVTDAVAEVVRARGLVEGQALVFVGGSTAALTTVEHEPGLVRDLPVAFERVAPRGARYHHDDTWHDGNGHSHVRASLVGPSLAVPVAERAMLIGTWQQIVLLDFDNRPRRRRLVVQLLGAFEERD